MSGAATWAPRSRRSVLLDGAGVDPAVGELEPLDGGVAPAAVLAAVDVEAIVPGELGHARPRRGEAGVGGVDGDDAAEADADGQQGDGVVPDGEHLLLGERAAGPPGVDAVAE